MPKFTVNSATLQEPVEVEIDGQVFAARPFRKDVFDRVREYDNRVITGDIGAGYERLAFLLPGAPAALIDSLEARAVMQITTFIINSIFGPTPGAAKNAPGPGGEK